MSSKNKVTYLVKNVGLLTASNFASKILSFFLVPVYTAVLTTEEYGTFDLVGTTVSLLVPLLTANIAEAVLRFALDEAVEDSDVLMVGVRYTLASIGAVAVAALVLQIAGIGGSLAPWWGMLLGLYASTSILALASSFARGMERVREVAIGGVVGSVSYIGLNILFLLGIKLGLIGFFLANILGSVAQVVYLVVSTHMWRFVRMTRANSGLTREMRAYSVPIMANSVAWWINGASDRYIVSAFCGVSENGIYSAGAKIPSILNVVQGIFNQAWVLSAVKDVDSGDSGGFFRRTYDAYGCLMVLACSLLIVLDRPIAHVLYAPEFYEAWRYAPFLMVAMVFGALSGHLGGAFAAAKDSAAYARSTVVGALGNIALNLALVPTFGALGAAVSTMVSYWVVWILRRRGVRHYVNVKFSLARDYSSYALLVVQGTLLLIVQTDLPLLYVTEAGAMLVLAMLYWNELYTMLRMAGRAMGRILHGNGDTAGAEDET